MVTDITYCTGIECPYREKCARYLGHYPTTTDYLSVFTEPPIVWNKDGTAYCESIKKLRGGE
jgi:hypothetical protein